MPELPEVETVVRGLQSVLPGRRIVEFRSGKINVIKDLALLGDQIPGSRLVAVRRYGKFLHLELEPLAREKAQLYILIHLGMTGQLTVGAASEPIAPHTHIFFTLDDGRELRFRDLRRFGRVQIVSESRREELLGKLGLDPLEATAEQFRDKVANRRARIKALLMDQHVFRGMGNIYTDESLWRARIHPARLGANLTAAEITKLRSAVQHVLNEAIRLRGSSVSDYVDSEGQNGEFQLRHRVYQREGKKCSRCGTKIQRIIVAGRSTHFCPQCQRAPRGRTLGKKSPRPRCQVERRIKSAPAKTKMPE
ncbi:MAG TPA: bifunctional DNA-formamidopyrimidine glycosylase/DNA-(apurinic or apyrimidinic site) lyase [Candidatus Acidoferrales bacterium]